jgi:hypothetical protein
MHGRRHTGLTACGAFYALSGSGTRRPRKPVSGDRNNSHGAGLDVEAWRLRCSG